MAGRGSAHGRVPRSHFCLPDKGAEELEPAPGRTSAKDERPGAGYNITHHRRILMRRPIRTTLSAR